MNLLKRIIGLKVLALIDYCDKVDMGISGRKLAQLKALAEAFQEMPKAYYIRGTTYFASILALPVLPLRSEPLPAVGALLQVLLSSFCLWWRYQEQRKEEHYP
ncbi:MAG: hypothetical protein E7H83_26505 [Enterobacteriaceae bacterium]|nr:hypothetical protein [Enterobacteriaceae bacterium]